MYQGKSEAIRIAPKDNNSFETFPYAIQKHLSLRPSDLKHCKYPAKSLCDQCKLVSEEVKKTTESTNSKNETQKIH